MKVNCKIFNYLTCSLLISGSFCFTCQLIASSSVSSLEEPVDIEKRSKAALKKFIDDFEGGHFTYISGGHLNHLPKEAIFGIWVTAKNQETIQSGRALAIAFTKKYLKELQNNKNTSDLYQYECSSHPESFSGKISLKNIGIRIAFWDDAVERPQVPYLAEIRFHQDKFRYYQADPKTQALTLVLEESYDDAVKQVESAQEK